MKKNHAELRLFSMVKAKISTSIWGRVLEQHKHLFSQKNGVREKCSNFLVAHMTSLSIFPVETTCLLKYLLAQNLHNQTKTKFYRF